MALNAPPTAILLVSIVATTSAVNQHLIRLIALATLVAVMLGKGFKKIIMKRVPKPSIDAKRNAE
jgi:hypothetical protein